MSGKAHTPRPVRVFLVAGEASGDELAAALTEPLREQFGGAVEFAGIGGPAMAARGIESPIPLSQLTVLGYIEGLMAWWRIARLARQAARHADDFGADIVVLVDSWGFTLRVAKALRALRPQALLVKYVGPQVWASRPGRSKTLAAHVDHLLSIHPFDAPCYEGTGLGVSFVGNPVLSRPRRGDGAALRKALHLPAPAKILLVLFGSRKAEFARLHQPFVQAVQKLRANHPDLVVMAPLSATIATQVRAAAASDPALQDMILLDEAQKADAFAAADLALACSGTVTTELAMAGVPMVAGYKMGALSWFVMKRFFLRTPYVVLVNVALGRMLVPEFLQDQCTPGRISAALDRLLDDKTLRQSQIAGLAEAIKIMGSGAQDTPHRAACIIHGLWQEKARGQ